MLTSISIMMLSGLFLGGLLKKIKLPPLIGMIIAGIILGPYALNLIDDSILNISSELRRIALVIILTRAGLSLDINSLKKVGRPAVLMCFVPACLEIIGCVLIAPQLLNINTLDAAILGSVIAAVSPAVIVPRMIKLIDEGYGKHHSIPELILAGASVDDVFVIVVFTAFTGLAASGTMNVLSFVNIPVSIILGILSGVITGLGLIILFKIFKTRNSVQMIIMLCVSFLLLQLEDSLADFVPVSGLLAIMSMGITFKQRYETVAVKLSNKYNKLWVGAELILFILVGATVDLKVARAAGVAAVIVVLGALIFRMVGVFLCLIKTTLTKKERFFCMMAYTPKATVQAAIGAVPLSMGLSCGSIVLTVAVLSILITAPFGAICIDNSYNKLLDKC